MTLTPTNQFDAGLEALHLSVSADERAALGRYLHRLLETNKQFNLTAIRDPDEAWMRHILDSLSLIRFLHADDPDPARLIDVGSGGGLPGVPIAITQPHLHVSLCEATGKKARFLQAVADDLGLDRLAIINDRAETIGQDKRHRQRYDIAVARAIGPMRVLLELTLPLVAVGGRVLAMKGRKVEAELDEAGDALMTLGGGAVELYEALPGLDADAVIVEVTKTDPTPRDYPRRPGEPKTNPL